MDRIKDFDNFDQFLESFTWNQLLEIGLLLV